MTMRAWVLAALLALTVAPAQSADRTAAEPGEVWEILDAEKIIDACWDMSNEQRASGNPADRAEGNLTSLLCLEEAAKTQIVAFEFKKPANEFARELRDRRDYLLALYAKIWNENPGCGRGLCGTANEARPYWAAATFFERMIEIAVYLRKREEF
jgi:hypothetical protein